MPTLGRCTHCSPWRCLASSAPSWLLGLLEGPKVLNSVQDRDT
uniref:Uncharacterized protein n=1 Tax=Anguilla anguilla TaxID=7936 RepID=A0A0E9QFN5_ANGAN